MGWVFYDDTCHLCRASANRFRTILTRRHFHLLPLQSPDALCRLDADAASLMAEMRLLLRDGTSLGGADAIIEIARRIWWAWPLWLLGQIPGAMPLLRSGYRLLAANRHCLNGVCLVTRGPRIFDWLPLALLPAAALLTRNHLPDWIFMWTLAFAMFFGCKWLTLRRTHIGMVRPPRLAALAYLLLWPGMDARGFFTPYGGAAPGLLKWLVTSAKTLVGFALFWLAISKALFHHDVANAWLGMIGIVLLLHFGLFHLLALMWQANGRNVDPIMRAPLLAKSLADFWGNRWNTGFNTLAYDFVFRPFVRRAGVAWTTLGVFLVSGIIHDLVISLPARGGYGLPTAYFLLQGFGILLERSHAGRALGLANGWRGRVFMLVTTATPIICLFHLPFIRNVILPMLHAFGATPHNL